MIVHYGVDDSYSKDNPGHIDHISSTEPVKVSYLNASGKVIKTQLLQVAALQQASIDLRTLTQSAATQSALLIYLTGAGRRAGWLQTTEYNALLQKQRQQSGLQQSSYQYDGRGLTQNVTIQKPTGLTSGTGGVISYQYNGFQYNLMGKLRANFLTRLLSQNGQTTPVASHASVQRRYNGLGELTQLTDQMGNQTLFAHHPKTGIVAQADIYANITYCRQYNKQGQPLHSWHVTANPGQSATTGLCNNKPPYYDQVWTYYKPGDKDSTGHLQPAGSLQSIAFDPNNPDHPEADTIYYSYYLDGALKRKRYRDGTAFSRQYNALGQVIQVSTYRGASAMSLVTLQSQHQYRYGGGAAHQLLQVQNTSGSLTVSYSYNPVGQLINISRTDSSDKLTVSTARTYTGYGLLHISSLCQDTQCSVNDPNARQNLTYTYQNGQLKQLQVTHPQISTEPDYSRFNYLKIYHYDVLNRLTGVQITNTTETAAISNLSYSLDINNNIQSVTKDGQITSYSYNAIDQLTSSASGHYPCQYNLVGNLTQGPDGTHYQYNDSNQLIEVVSPHGQYTYYSYYPDGELQHEFQYPNHQSTNTPNFKAAADGFTFFYSQGQVARIVDKQSNWTSYLGGLSREAVIYHHQAVSTQIQFYAYQGKTPSGWLNSSHQASWQRRGPYGQISATLLHSNNGLKGQLGLLSLTCHPHLIGFNGSYQDRVTGLIFMGARVYCSSLKRFLQRDNANVANRYAYAQGNPVEKYDPSGHMAKWLNWLLGVGMSALAVVGSIVSFGAATPALFAADVSVSAAIFASSSALTVVGSSLSLASNSLELTGHHARWISDLNYAGMGLAGLGALGMISFSIPTANAMVEAQVAKIEGGISQKVTSALAEMQESGSYTYYSSRAEDIADCYSPEDGVAIDKNSKAITVNNSVSFDLAYNLMQKDIQSELSYGGKIFARGFNKGVRNFILNIDEDSELADSQVLKVAKDEEAKHAISAQSGEFMRKLYEAAFPTGENILV